MDLSSFWPAACRARFGIGDRLAAFDRRRPPGPSAQQILAARAQWQERDIVAALRDGEQIVPAASNGSLGTRAYSLRVLAMAGLMRCETLAARHDRQACHRFSLTACGRQQLEAGSDGDAAAGGSRDGLLA